MHDRDTAHQSVQGGVKAAESEGRTNFKGGYMAHKKVGKKYGKKHGKKRGHKK